MPTGRCLLLSLNPGFSFGFASLPLDLTLVCPIPGGFVRKRTALHAARGRLSFVVNALRISPVVRDLLQIPERSANLEQEFSPWKRWFRTYDTRCEC